ncbi:uncharacterized protein LOC129313812 [Prosopis cineraria]|uniref:uncharacterized protein LOC129313812 n=1 Tax=Prosopis cineraria TaxID=364024 RepID=UPI002410268D|nr:uncharacterized protein LOC129313812 [Prosopis cineraria]
MTRQLMPQSPPVVPRGKHRAGEIAGGTAAECAAVCCCCPCAVVNILVLAVYRVPAGLCKKAIRRRRRLRLQKMKNKMYLQQQSSNNGNAIITLEQCLSEEMKTYGIAGTAEKVEEGSEADELEKEMWARFQGTGFWRSSSRRLEP